MKAFEVLDGLAEDFDTKFPSQITASCTEGGESVSCFLYPTQLLLLCGLQQMEI